MNGFSKIEELKGLLSIDIDIWQCYDAHPAFPPNFVCMFVPVQRYYSNSEKKTNEPQATTDPKELEVIIIGYFPMHMLHRHLK